MTGKEAGRLCLMLACSIINFQCLDLGKLAQKFVIFPSIQHICRQAFYSFIDPQERKAENLSSALFIKVLFFERVS